MGPAHSCNDSCIRKLFKSAQFIVLQPIYAFTDIKLFLKGSSWSRSFSVDFGCAEFTLTHPGPRIAACCNIQHGATIFNSSGEILRRDHMKWFGPSYHCLSLRKIPVNPSPPSFSSSPGQRGVYLRPPHFRRSWFYESMVRVRTFVGESGERIARGG